MKRYETVDAFMEDGGPWRDELRRLRRILLSTELQETVKWGAPCYTYEGKNVVGIGAFKAYFGLWFFQGALLSDKKNVLLNAQEGKTKALRQWRFGPEDKIDAKAVKSYVKEAIALAKEGREIKPARAKPLALPPQFARALAKNKKAKACYEALSKGKQREYAEYIAEAKREETKRTRLDKIVPMILAGKGLNDKYRAR